MRELRQTVEHAAFLTDRAVIDDVHVAHALSRGCASGALFAHELEKGRILVELLDAQAGDVAAVARVLDIDRSTAYRRMHRMGIAVALRGPRRWPSVVGKAAELTRWDA